MKNILFILFATIILSACGKQKNQQQSDNNGNVIMDTTGNALSEKNMKYQFREYLVAFNTGDFDKAIHYIYPDMFEYLVKQYPDEKLNMQTIKDSIFIEPMKKMKKIAKEKKLNFEFEIGEISKKVNYKDARIYVVLATIVTKSGLDKHSFSDEVVAISSDKGENWQFVQIDQDSPETVKGILNIKYPKSVINELFSK
jgi:hypothetical protein